MQNDDMIVVANLVDEMGRPEDADSLVGDEAAHDLEKASTRLDVEPGGRLVEQQHARPVQERARNLDPPHLPAGEIAHFVMGTIGETDARELRGLSHARLAGPNSVQGAMVGEVLRDAEIGIESALLEYDAEQRERGAALARDVSAEDSHDA